MRPAIPDTMRNGPRPLLSSGTVREPFVRYGSSMSGTAKFRVSPMGHHAIDKEAATMMRINKVMISTLPASLLLPGLLPPLLVLSFPSQPVQLRPGTIYFMNCIQYNLPLRHSGSPLDTNKPTSRATLLLNP